MPKLNPMEVLTLRAADLRNGDVVNLAGITRWIFHERNGWTQLHDTPDGWPQWTFLYEAEESVRELEVPPEPEDGVEADVSEHFIVLRLGTEHPKESDFRNAYVVIHQYALVPTQRDIIPVSQSIIGGRNDEDEVPDVREVIANLQLTDLNEDLWALDYARWNSGNEIMISAGLAEALLALKADLRKKAEDQLPSSARIGTLYPEGEHPLDQ